MGNPGRIRKQSPKGCNKSSKGCNFVCATVRRAFSLPWKTTKEMYRRIVDKEKREATVSLYGTIGEEVPGNQVALDIAAMDGQVDTINILVNSNGGDVLQGLSIVSAILSAKAFIHARVNGIAASMAAVITVAADRVTMQDYAKLMVHDPFYAGTEGGKMTDKERKALESVADTLRTILSRRGCGKGKIAKLMSDETWFTADEAVAAGLADEVAHTGRKEEYRGLSASEILNKAMSEKAGMGVNNQKTKRMNEIAKALGLPEDATEEQILNAIQKVKKENEEQRDAAVAALLAMGEKKGIVTGKNKERMARLAAADLSLFIDLMEDKAEGPEKKEQAAGGLAGRLSRLSDAISLVKGKGAQSPKPERSWDWYQRNDPQALMEMERNDPERFNRLLDEYEQSI